MNDPSPSRIAVIDVGSNSIRYMEAAVTPNGVTAFVKRLTTTRLGEGLEESGRLQSAPMARSMAAIAAFVCQAGKLPLYAYATSAVRDAENRADFLELVQRETGLAIRVLTGEEEARAAYRGAVGARGGGLVDIGGGSTQVVSADFAKSYPVGCVRLRDTFGHLPFAQARGEILRFIESRCHLSPDALYGCPCFTGVGGTIATLGALSLGLTSYDPAAIMKARLTPRALESLILSLVKQGEARRAHPLLVNRHDTILYGAAVLAFLMERLCMNEISVSDADGMEGFLLLL